MTKKPRATVILPERIAEVIENRRELLDESKGEYVALIVKWWWSQGTPPVSMEEAFILKKAGIDPVKDLEDDIKRVIAEQLKQSATQNRKQRPARDKI